MDVFNFDTLDEATNRRLLNNLGSSDWAICQRAAEALAIKSFNDDELRTRLRRSLFLIKLQRRVKK